MAIRAEVIAQGARLPDHGTWCGRHADTDRHTRRRDDRTAGDNGTAGGLHGLALPVGDAHPLIVVEMESGTAAFAMALVAAKPATRTAESTKCLIIVASCRNATRSPITRFRFQTVEFCTRPEVIGIAEPKSRRAEGQDQGQRGGRRVNIRERIKKPQPPWLSVLCRPKPWEGFHAPDSDCNSGLPSRLPSRGEQIRTRSIHLDTV
jgi:hypothetical protein